MVTVAVPYRKRDVFSAASRERRAQWNPGVATHSRVRRTRPLRTSEWPISVPVPFTRQNTLKPLAKAAKRFLQQLLGSARQILCPEPSYGNTQGSEKRVKRRRTQQRQRHCRVTAQRPYSGKQRYEQEVRLYIELQHKSCFSSSRNSNTHTRGSIRIPAAVTAPPSSGSGTF